MATQFKTEVPAGTPMDPSRLNGIGQPVKSTGPKVVQDTTFQPAAATPAASTQTPTTTPGATPGTTPTTAPAVPGTVTTPGTVPATGPATTLQSAFQRRQDESAAKIGGLYDLQLASQRAALDAAYQQNLSDQEAAKANIGRQYQASANDLAVQYERNRRNLNQQALANGLNTGAASQQQLHLNQGWLRNYGTLRGQEAQAQTEADRQITNLKNNYQNSIAQAIADNDYKRAAALLDDYNNQQKWLDRQAQILAGYGDFSAYISLYGVEAANQMKQMWIIQNPDAAYATGQIDKKTYKKITGRNPGQKKSNGGSYFGGYSSEPPQEPVAPISESGLPNLPVYEGMLGDIADAASGETAQSRQDQLREGIRAAQAGK